MRRVYAIICCIFLCAWTHGSVSVPTADVVCTFATGNCTGTGGGLSRFTAGTCNGSADDTAAFDSFNTWATGTWQASHAGLIQLNLPAATCLWTPGGGGGTGPAFSYGIKKLLVSGYGTTLGGTYFHLNGAGEIQDNNHSTRLLTVAAGASKVTVNPGSASQPTGCNSNATCTGLFPTGRWALISGFNLQGFGFPGNWFYFEFVQIDHVDPTTGEVFFTAPLVNGYKQTWPYYDSGDGIDDGGPATLYILDPGWDQEVEYDGINFNPTPNEVDATGRKSVFRDITWTQPVAAQACLFGSMNLQFQIINSTLLNCVMEVDKEVDSFVMTGSTMFDFNLQSTGANTMTVSNSTVHSLTGSARLNIFTDVTFTGAVTLGPNQGFGRTDEMRCTRCAIPTFNAGGYQRNVSNIAGITMSGGVITIPDSSIGIFDHNWFVPGNNIAWTDDQLQAPWSTFWQVTGVTQSGGNTVIATSLASGFPTIPTSSSGTIVRIFVHPSPKFTCTSCTGDPRAVYQNNATPAAPLWSYAQYTYAGSIGAVTQANPIFWGNAAQINANVTAAYGAAGALNFEVMGTYTMNTAANALANYDPIVNAKSVGNRQIVPSGVTCPSGTCTGDTGLTLPNSTASIFKGASGAGGPNYSSDVSGSCPGVNCPSVTVTIQTDQGVVNP